MMCAIWRPLLDIASKTVSIFIIYISISIFKSWCKESLIPLPPSHPPPTPPQATICQGNGVEILTEAEEGEDPLHHSCCLQSSVQRHFQRGKINLHVSHKWTKTDKWATDATHQEEEEEEERLNQVQSLLLTLVLSHTLSRRCDWSIHIILLTSFFF